MLAIVNATFYASTITYSYVYHPEIHRVWLQCSQSEAVRCLFQTINASLYFVAILVSCHHLQPTITAWLCVEHICNVAFCNSIKTYEAVIRSHATIVVAAVCVVSFASLNSLIAYHFRCVPMCAACAVCVCFKFVWLQCVFTHVEDQINWDL